MHMRNKKKSNEFELTPIVESSKKPVRRICKLPIREIEFAAEDIHQTSGPGETSSSNQREASSSNKLVVKLQESHPRFVPLYSTVDQPSVDATKEKVWEHVVTPLVESSEKPVRREIESAAEDIHQTSGPGETSNQREALSSNKLVVKLEESHPRFGPLYSTVDQPLVDATKEKAWEHVLKMSPEKDQSETKEIYSSAIKKVEQEAKEAYAEKVSGIGTKFLWTMIKDGCFFLQLALLILGATPEQLGYPSYELIFGKEPSKKEVKKWIEAMFYAGNQIPLVVLRELMNQQFFQDVLAKGKWDFPQSDLCKKVFYEFLVSPARKRSNQGLFRKERIVNSDQQPSDLLHGLQQQVLGPGPPDHLPHEYEADEEFDLEANEEEIGRIFPTNIDDGGEGASTSLIGDRKRIFSSATELNQAGIRIKKLKNGGVRSIHFKSYYLWAFLYLPAFPVDDNTETLFRNLKCYEISPQFGEHRREVSSYIRVMSDIVRRRTDVKLLQKKGIIQGRPNHAEKLPSILNRLSSEEIGLTHELRLLRRQISDFSSPLIHYKGVINLVVFLTLVQTVLALLAYFRPPR